MENVPMPNGIGMAPGGFMTPGMNFEDSRFVALMNRANTFPLAHSPPRPAHGGLADGWTDWSSWSLCSPIAGGMPVRTRACLQNDVLRPPALQTVLGGGWAYSKKGLRCETIIRLPFAHLCLQKRRCGPSRSF
ncbi:hypothetical protein QR680_012697 [Steinernema hermaphroditum]|uniref:Uncharacterized protein n=1 Tax=Steinernema hermaphroditum TaxID=289476 RepID=A0AA39M0Y8_9BILA|nr:hypothetical protein QR680_012697 [Steinernema hermaphroditum]